MRGFLWLLLPAALLGGQARYARLGEFAGKVEVQLDAAAAWAGALRNLPLPESSWLRTGADGKIEIELDDGAAFRLGPDSLAELSDYTRLSTGQRITVLSLDRGIAYFTGQAEGLDAVTLVVPGAQAIVRRGTRIRLEAGEDASQIAVIEGSVRFSAPAAEFDLIEGQTARVEPARTSRFFLYREVTANELDRWSEQRDQLLASSSSGRHVPVGYGVADLDGAGEWVQTDDLGAVWKPKTAEGWVPYRFGKWQWYDTLGYTWVSADAWGWLPYHYGRWTRREQLGWIWVPSKRPVFKPAEVYWLRGARIAGWGPLAPGEEWNSPAAPPQQFLNANTTWSTYAADAVLLDPAAFDSRPKEPLGVAAFTLALPSPAFLAAKLDAGRPPLRAGSTRIVPVLPGITYANPRDAAPTQAAAPEPVAVVTNPGGNDAPVVTVQQAPPPPQDVIYPVPVYTGIIVVNPPEDDGGRRRRRGSQQHQQAQQPQDQPKPSSAPTPAPAQPARSVVTRPETAESRGRQTPPATPAPPVAAAPPAPPRSSIPRPEGERSDTRPRYTPPAAAPPPAERKPDAAKTEAQRPASDSKPAGKGQQ